MHRNLKWLLLSSVIVFSLGLFGCGGNSSATQSDANPSTAEETTESDLKSEEFKDVVLVDNDSILITLQKFYQQNTNWIQSDGSLKPMIVDHIVVKYKDKTDNGTQVYVNAYLDDEEMYAANTFTTIEAGKAKTADFTVGKNTQPDFTELDSFDDLYNVSLAFEISVQDENGAISSDSTSKIEVNLEDAINGKSASGSEDDAAKSEDESKAADESEKKEAAYKPLNVGDTVSNDDWEVTLVSANLTKEALPPDTSGWYASVEANDGTVFLELDFDVKCLASQLTSVTDALGGARATYAGKYEYDTVELYYEWDESHLSGAGRLAIDPLQTLRIHYLICNIPEEAASSDESLTALVKLVGQVWELKYR